MSESEIAKLCREIYRKHKDALDLIYLHIPDRQAAIKEVLEEMVSSTPGLLLDRSIKTEIDFIPKEWDVPLLQKGSGWTQSGRILLFAIDNRPNKVRINLYIGPGPVDIRQKLLDIAQANHPPFRSAYRNLNQKWNNIYIRMLLNQREIEDLEFEALVEKLKTEWQKFLNSDFREIDKILKQNNWIWAETHEQQPIEDNLQDRQ